MATLFETKVVKFMPRLMRDVSCDVLDSAAIFGNVGHECNGFQTMQEIGVKPPKGGWGWQQWTGARRRQFEAWADARNLDRSSDEANYGFMVWELLNTEKASLAATKKAVGLNLKTDTFEKTNERAGVPALASRRKYAKIALDAYNASLKAPVPAPSPPPPDIPAEPPAAVPESSSPVSGGTVAGTIAAGGVLTTIAAAVDRWQAWLALGVLVAVVATILILARRKG
jgi:hypothetical protein